MKFKKPEKPQEEPVDLADTFETIFGGDGDLSPFCVGHQKSLEWRKNAASTEQFVLWLLGSLCILLTLGCLLFGFYNWARYGSAEFGTIADYLPFPETSWIGIASFISIVWELPVWSLPIPVGVTLYLMAANARRQKESLERRISSALSRRESDSPLNT